jgi:pimeloyl-ACP methyl ester carboxylesterase
MSSLSLKQCCRRGFAVLTLRTPAFWERSWKHRLARLGVYFALFYVAFLLLLLALEDRFLYGPRDANLYDPPAGIAVENVEMTSRLGDRIHAWWSTPSGWRPEQGAVIFCHGNAFNLSIRAGVMPHWHRELGQAVLLFDYPGYGRSSGSPSEAGCYAAGEAGYDWLTGVQNVPGERIILYGGSLGGGTATELAHSRPHRALVLVASFTSFPDMAQLRFPFMPGRWLVRNQFDNLGKIADCKGPVFVAHGTLDDLIPLEQGERLFAAAREPKRLLRMANFRHNDLPADEFYPALRDFLADCERPAN